MKKLTVLSVILLTGCSSINYISTEPYEQNLKENCINKLTNKTKESEKKCILNASSRTHFAYRMYQTRAKTDHENCSQKHSTKAEIESCFKNAQDEYYKELLK